jgi:hypothetical protein
MYIGMNLDQDPVLSLTISRWIDTQFFQLGQFSHIADLYILHIMYSSFHISEYYVTSAAETKYV